MPLFFQQHVHDDTRLAVWQITEDETFFRQLALPQREVPHPHKRLQHLSGRYLLQHLFPEFPSSLVRIADTRKPYLEDEAFHFSISHCSTYAAAIVSRSLRVGIDIEVITGKAARIRPKFATDAEWAIVQNAWGANAVTNGDADAVCATLIWSCKEAVFKWYGNGEVDFRQHMVIEACESDAGVWNTTLSFRKGEPMQLTLHSRLMAGLWLSFIA